MLLNDVSLLYILICNHITIYTHINLNTTISILIHPNCLCTYNNHSHPISIPRFSDSIYKQRESSTLPRDVVWQSSLLMSDYLLLLGGRGRHDDRHDRLHVIVFQVRRLGPCCSSARPSWRW